MGILRGTHDGLRCTQDQLVRIIDRMHGLQMQDYWSDDDSKRFSELANQKLILENKLRIEERMSSI